MLIDPHSVAKKQNKCVNKYIMWSFCNPFLKAEVDFPGDIKLSLETFQ